MRKREHLKKLKKGKLEAHGWLPALLNLSREEIEQDQFIESRLIKLKEAGFYPFDIDNPSVLEHLKKYPASAAKDILDLFEFREILLAIVSWKSGNIRIFTRIYTIKDYISRGRQWRTKLAGDILDAWFKNHKFRYTGTSFNPETESYTDKLKLRLSAFITDFTIEQHISSCETCGRYFLRQDGRFKTCGRNECAHKSIAERRNKLRRLRDKRFREYWDKTVKQNETWGEWRAQYRTDKDGAKSSFLAWYGDTYPSEMQKLRSYGLLRHKR